MDVLAEKFEIYRDAVLSDLDISTDFLKLMSDAQLLDQKESARYKAMENKEHRNLKLMTAMTQLRTDRSYTILLQCLRNSGQNRVADLLTDLTHTHECLTHEAEVEGGGKPRVVVEVEDEEDEEEEEEEEGGGKPRVVVEVEDDDDDEEEDEEDEEEEEEEEGTGEDFNKVPQILSHEDNGTQSSLLPVRKSIAEVHHRLDSILKHISPFLSKEERRIGIPTKMTPKEQHVDVTRSTDGPCDYTDTNSVSRTPEQTLGQCVHDTMADAVLQIGRSEEVISKLHTDCQAVAEVNGDIMLHVKDCSARLREILRTHRIPVEEIPVPQRTTELFRVLMEDAETLAGWRSRALVRDQQTRTQSMRILRRSRDRLDERCRILRQVHSMTSSRARPKKRQTSTRLSVNYTPNTSFITSPAISNVRSPELSIQSPSNTSNIPTISTHSDRFEMHGSSDIVYPCPIRSVAAGLNLLEEQIRQYVHLEVLMTDKFRSQQRIKILQKKAQGYSSNGFGHAKQHIDRIEQGTDVDENLARIRGIVAKSSEEYEQCNHYLKKATAGMPRVQDISISDVSRDSGSELMSSSRFSFFKKKPKEAAKELELRLPKLVEVGTVVDDVDGEHDCHGKPLLSRLKTLVSNYQAAKSNEKMLVERFRLDWDIKKRELVTVVRKKEDELVRLNFRIKEIAADRDKYRRLYEQTKLKYVRKL